MVTKFERSGAHNRERTSIMATNILSKFLIAAVLVSAATSPSLARKGDPTIGRQSCIGILTRDEGGLLLKPGASPKSLWCDAYINDNEVPGIPSLARQVLRGCSVGERCHIEGSFEGHGGFYWNQITKVTH
jgi:hypothetical protein